MENRNEGASSSEILSERDEQKQQDMGAKAFEAMNNFRATDRDIKDVISEYGGGEEEREESSDEDKETLFMADHIETEKEFEEDYKFRRKAADAARSAIENLDGLISLGVKVDIDSLVSAADAYVISENIERLLAAGADAGMVAEKISPEERLEYYEKLRSVGTDINIDDIARELIEDDPESIFDNLDKLRSLGANIDVDHLLDRLDREEMGGVSIYIKQLLSMGANPDKLVSLLMKYPTEILDNAEMLKTSGAHINANEIIDHLTSYDVNNYCDILLSLGADANKIVENIDAPLFVLENIDKLYAAGAEININELVGRIGDDAVASYFDTLLAKGADVNNLIERCKSRRGWAESKLEKLLSAGVDANAIVQLISPLGVLRNIEKLKDAGANIGINELVSKLSDYDIKNYANLLLEAGADVNLVFDHLNVAIMPHELDKYLDMGISADKLMEKMMSSTIRDNAEKLIKAGADANIVASHCKFRGMDYYTCEATINKLLKAGIEANAIVSRMDGETLSNHCYELLKAGADAKVVAEKLEETGEYATLLSYLGDFLDKDVKVDVDKIAENASPRLIASHLETLRRAGADIDIDELTDELKDIDKLRNLKDLLDAGAKIDGQALYEKFKGDTGNGPIVKNIVELRRAGADIDIDELVRNGYKKYSESEISSLLEAGASVDKLISSSRFDVKYLEAHLDDLLSAGASMDVVTKKLLLDTHYYLRHLDIILSKGANIDFDKLLINAKYQKVGLEDIDNALGVLLAAGINIDPLIREYPAYAARRLDKITAAGADVNIESLLSSLGAEQKAYFLENLIAAGAEIDVNGLIDELEPKSVYSNIDKLLSAGGDVNMIVAKIEKLGARYVVRKIDTLKEQGANIDAGNLAEKAATEGEYDVFDNFNKLLAAGADVNKLSNALSSTQKLYFIKELLDGGVALDINDIVKDAANSGGTGDIVENIDKILGAGADADKIVEALGDEGLEDLMDRNPDDLDVLLASGADAERISEKLSSEMVLANYEALSVAGANIDVDKLTNEVEPEVVVRNLDTLLAAGANIDVDQLVDRADSEVVIRNLDTLLAAGANIDGDKLVKSLTYAETLLQNLDKVISLGASIDVVVDVLHPSMIVMNLDKLLTAGANIDVEELLKKVGSFDICSNMEQILATGAKVDVDSIMKHLDSGWTEYYLDKLLAAGADANKLVAKLEMEDVAKHLDKLIAAGADINPDLYR